MTCRYMTSPEGHDTSLFGSVPCILVSYVEGHQLLSALSGQAATGFIYESNVVARRLFQYTQLYTSGSAGTRFSRSLRGVR